MLACIHVVNGSLFLYMVIFIFLIKMHSCCGIFHICRSFLLLSNFCCMRIWMMKQRDLKNPGDVCCL